MRDSNPNSSVLELDVPSVDETILDYGDGWWDFSNIEVKLPADEAVSAWLRLTSLVD